MNLLPFEPKTAEELFLFRVCRVGAETSRLGPARLEALQRFLGGSASEFMDAWVVAFPHGRAQERALSDAIYRLNIGLEIRSDGDSERAVDELERGDFFSCLQEGKAQLARLRQRTGEVRNRLHFQNPLPTALSVLDELNLANTLEEVFLNELEKGRLALTKPAPRLTAPAPPRPLTSLFDLALGGEMLDNLEARSDIFRVFPPSRLFSENYPADEYGDVAWVVLSRWLARIAVSGRMSADFRVTAADLFLCRERLDDPKTLPALQEQIERFIHARIAPSRQRAARAYLFSCLNSLSSFCLLNSDF